MNTEKIARLPKENADILVRMLLLVLTIFILLLLGLDLLIELDPEVSRMIRVIDFVVCMIFLGDFARNLARAPSKWYYFRTWGWIDLLSSIPMIEPLRLGRLAVLFRLARLVHGGRMLYELNFWFRANKAKGTVITGMFAGLLMVLASSVMVLWFEKDRGDINTAEIALWYSLATVTTVGYGDYAPATTGGRVMASVMMVVGISLFSIITAWIASTFIAPVEREERIEEKKDLRQQIEQLTKKLDELEKGTGKPDGDSP